MSNLSYRSTPSPYSDDICLVSGTLRSNLDPFELHDDAQLWDALKRSYLVDTQKQGYLNPDDGAVPSGAQTPMNKFTLDHIIEDEGGNLSVGQVDSLQPLQINHAYSNIHSDP